MFRFEHIRNLEQNIITQIGVRKKLSEHNKQDTLKEPATQAGFSVAKPT